MRWSEWMKGSQGHDQTSRSWSDLKEEGRRLNRNHVVNGCLSTVEPYREGEASLQSLERKLHTVINEKDRCREREPEIQECLGRSEEPLQKAAFRVPPWRNPWGESLKQTLINRGAIRHFDLLWGQAVFTACDLVRCGMQAWRSQALARTINQRQC